MSDNPSHGSNRSPASQSIRACLRCWRPLPPNETERCPRCFWQFDPENPNTYRSLPAPDRWKFWLPGLALSIVSGVLSYAVIITTGEMGLALFISVPVSFGAILGYATRASVWLTVCLSFVAIAAVITGIVSLSLAGFFCGATLGMIYLAPVLFGVLLGWGLGAFLRQTRWSQRHYLPLILWMTLPYACECVENLWPRPAAVASVATGMSFDATPAEAWNSILFYEEVEHEAPWLLRLALPKPKYSQGSKAATGNVVRCVYDRGHLVKQISQCEPGRRLAFRVLEQQLHFERDVTLLDGAFEIQPAAVDGHVHVVLSTRYVRHLRPAWLWEPIERQVVHALHAHVLEGMRRRVTPVPAWPEPYQPETSPGRSPLLAQSSAGSGQPFKLSTPQVVMRKRRR